MRFPLMPYMDAPGFASTESKKWSAPIYPASCWNPLFRALMNIRALLVLITLSTLGRSMDKTDSVVMTDRPFIISDCKLVVAVKTRFYVVL